MFAMRRREFITLLGAAVTSRSRRMRSKPNACGASGRWKRYLRRSMAPIMAPSGNACVTSGTSRGKISSLNIAQRMVATRACSRRPRR